MAAWSSPRVLAPLALIASLLAVVVVLATASVDAPEPSLSRSATTTPAETRPDKPAARTYLVKPGDNLTVIAEKTGVDVETLERLNPDLDPQALLAGERIKLVP